MKIILKNIPITAGKQEIYDFIAPTLKGGLFRKNGKIVNISLLVFKNLALNSLIQHGLVEIKPDSVASRTLKMLNRKKLKGKHIGIQEYYVRTWHNERRIPNNPAKPAIDRRLVDRRKLGLVKLDDLDAEIVPNKLFYRRHD